MRAAPPWSCRVKREIFYSQEKSLNNRRFLGEKSGLIPQKHSRLLGPVAKEWNGTYNCRLNLQRNEKNEVLCNID